MQSLFFYSLKNLLTLASGLGEKKKLFILIYHRVLDSPDFMRPGEVDKKAFAWQVELLAKYFNVLSLGDALDKLQTNQLPSRAVSITFDDGYADNFLNALPILKRYNLKATFFIASGYLNGGIMWNDKIIEGVRCIASEKLNLHNLGLEEFDVSNKAKKEKSAQQIINKVKHFDSDKRQEVADFIMSKVDQMPTDIMMTEEQLIQLHKAGMEIGGHTVSHPIMAKLDEQSVKQELKNNKLKLEQLLKITIRFFAYPNGKPGTDYKPEQIEQVKAQGYEAAVSTQWGAASPQSDLYQLPRFTPWDTTPIRFIFRMLSIYMKPSK